jgi:tetratricopeptide (TPR) repeat protein
MLGDGLWKAMLGGIHFSRGIGFTYEFGPRALEVAHEMEQVGVRVWAMAAEEVRMLYHALRGETEAMRRCRERVELFAVQGSTTWQADIYWPILLMDSEIRAGDSIAVRTIREQLTRRAKDHPSLQAFADVAHATYLTLRGEHSAAIAAFERMHDKFRVVEPALTWPAFRAGFAFAQALNAVGEHARAKRYASESLSRAGADAGRVVGHYLEPHRQLALAEAGLGNHAEAVRILDDLLAAHGHEDQPLLIGLLHKARAEVALQMNDLDAFETHFAQMERRFSGTQNPTLVAQTDRLARRAAELRSREGEVAAPVIQKPLEAVSVLTRRALDDLATASDRPAVALGLILHECRGKAGFLYLLNGSRLELAAASSRTEPARRFEALLQRDLQQAQRRAEEEEDLTAAVDPERAPAVGHSMLIDSVPPGQPPSVEPSDEMYRMLVLRTQRSGETVVVGGLIIELDPQRGFAVDSDLLEPIASILCDGLAGSSANSSITLA